MTYFPHDLCVLVRDYARPLCVLLLGLGEPLDDATYQSFLPLCQEVIQIPNRTLPVRQRGTLPFSMTDDQIKVFHRSAMVGLRLLHLFAPFVETWGWQHDSVSLQDIFFVIPVLLNLDQGRLVLNPQWKDDCISLEPHGIYTIPNADRSYVPSVVIYSFANLSNFHFLKDMGSKERAEVRALEKTRHELVLQLPSKHYSCPFATWKSGLSWMREELDRIQEESRQFKEELREISAALEKF